MIMMILIMIMMITMILIRNISAVSRPCIGTGFMGT